MILKLEPTTTSQRESYLTNNKIVQAHLPCPDTEVCGSSDAYAIWDDGHGFCFSCNKTFNKERKGYIEPEFTYEYLPRRNISAETFRFFETKTKVNGDGKPVAVGYKYPNGSYKIRNLEKKEFYTEGDISKAGLFGRDKFAAGGSRYVTVTEGEDDAHSFYDVLQGPVVSVKSASSAVSDCTSDWEWLNSFERIYLAFDSDAAGREALSKVARLFDYNKIYHVKFTNRKDATDYLEHGERQQLKNIWWNSKKYLPDSIVSSFSDFKDILSKPDPVGIPYPFPTLTRMTYGIRPGESVLITAQEGVGKTEVMHAIEYQILRHTDDAVGAIFLEEPKKRHLQAIAGIELQKPVRLPNSGVSDEETFDAVQRVVREDDRLHVYSHFGSDDPEVILDTIRFLVSARNCRYILLDHITMVVSGLAGEEERRALDYLTTRLEMMVQELNFSLIFVSHVNDHGQTRGSRYIGKICHIRIDLTRDVENGSNEIHLSIPKNRFGMKTGPAGVIVFDPEKYQFRELGDEGFAAANDNEESDGQKIRAKA